LIHFYKRRRFIMADRKRAKKKGQAEDETPAVLDKTHKAVLKWLRGHVPVKKTKFMHSHVVEYFTSGKAIDALMTDSPWAKEKAKEGSDLILESRFQAINVLDQLLVNKMFHRARKIPVMEKEKKKKKDVDSGKEDSKEEDGSSPKQRKGKGKEVQEVEEKSEREKKKRKIRLEMHNDQCIVDGNEAYVWLYDPTPWYYYVAGTAIVLGIIAVCLFPLWPTEMRQGVYYLSVAAAGFLVFIIVLAILKYILFLVLFIATAGKLRLWIFPNLTEDVGFLESFMPMYVYTYSGPKKSKESDDEESSEEESDDEDEDKKTKEAAGDGDGEASETGKGEPGSDSGGSSKEFEMVEKA